GSLSGAFLVTASSPVPVTSTSDSSASNTGGLIGYLGGGVIQKCSSTGNVTNATANAGSVGGLVGNLAGGSIRTCYSTGTVSAAGTNASQVGGLVGTMANGTSISLESYSSSDVNAAG